MIQELGELRDKIRMEMCNGQYKLSLKLLDEYSQRLNGFNGEDMDFERWFANYNLAHNYYKLGEIETAITYIEKSMERYKTNTCFYQSLWLLGSCHEQLKNDKEAIEIYRGCYSFFKDIESQDLRFCLIFNIARLKSMPNIMKLIIKVYQNGNYTNSVKTYGDMTKEINLKNMYKELFDLYIGCSDLMSAITLVNSIKNIELKKELTKLLRSKMLIAS